MGRYGKGMRDCCDSPAQRNQDHVKGCPSSLAPLDEARLREATVYGTAACPYCDKAKALLTERGIPLTYYDVDQDETAFDALHKAIGSWKTVPQIFIDGDHVGGFDALKDRLG